MVIMETNEEKLSKTVSSLHRFSQPEEVGQASVWLVSDYLSYVTGTCLPVDGGFLSRW